ncbi:MAG: YihY/virulence factor BrkB family protein [bacterium]|nr:YihY/virulence factor BrkB family protein [bacterium]
MWKGRSRGWLEGLETHPRLGIAYRTIQKTLHDRARDMAATIAFYALLSIFPLLIGGVAGISYLLDDPRAQAKIYRFVEDSIPGSAGLVQANVEAVVRQRGAMGLVGALGLLWSATAAFGAITRCINLAWGAERNHPFYMSKPRAFLMAVAVALLMLAAVASTAVVEVWQALDLALLQKLGLELDLEMPGSARIQARVASVGFIFLIFALLYKVVPYERPTWRQVLPGALLATVLFELGKSAFLLYLDWATHFEAVYGSLSSIIVLLIWLYVSALVLIVGAEFIIVRSEQET